MRLSLVVPCFNEEKNIKLFYNEVRKVFENCQYTYEMIFINDGSTDKTLSELKNLQKQSEKNIKIVSFSRNFGKEAAILAGLKKSSGEYVSLIDADLQQRPEIVKDMVAFLDENIEYDSVAAFQEERNEGKILTLFKRSFYKIINNISEVRFVMGASDFRTLRRTMVDAILEMSEYHRFSKGIFSWVGFNTYFIPYHAEERANGDSKWSFIKLFKYAVEGIISFTTLPLRLATFMGIITFSLSIIYMVVVIIQKLFFSIAVPGYTTIVVLILILGGMQFLSIGIIGEYLARTYIQVKKRPIYIIKETITFEDDQGNQSDQYKEKS